MSWEAAVKQNMKTASKLMRTDLNWEFEQDPLTSGTKTFAENLEFLMTTTGIKSSLVCEHLKISRTQFSRYRGGQSFPKPHILVALCELFSVDSKILTHKIKTRHTNLGSEPQQVYSEAWALLTKNGNFSPVQEMTDILPPDSADVRDGIYRVWFPAAVEKGVYLSALSQIRTIDGVKLFETRDVNGVWGRFPKSGSRSRRHTGLCFRQSNGFCAIHFIGASKMKFFSSYEPLSRYRPDCFGGVNLWTADTPETPFVIQPSVLEKLPTDTSTVLSAAREAGRCKLESIPSSIREYFEEIRSGEKRFVHWA